jgi:hypothetical protein
VPPFAARTSVLQTREMPASPLVTPARDARLRGKVHVSRRGCAGETYQILARALSGRYIRSPGFTSNAS